MPRRDEQPLNEGLLDNWFVCGRCGKASKHSRSWTAVYEWIRRHAC